MGKHREKHDNFLFGLLTKKVKGFWYFSNKNVFLTKFWFFLTPFYNFLLFLKFFFLNEIFNIMFLFQVKSVIPSVTGQNHCKFLHFMFVKAFFWPPNIFLGAFHYFGHHGRFASQIFNLLLSFYYFNPAILFIKKKIAFCAF